MKSCLNKIPEQSFQFVHIMELISLTLIIQTLPSQIHTTERLMVTELQRLGQNDIPVHFLAPILAM